jgi:hypothetical protein
MHGEKQALFGNDGRGCAGQCRRVPAFKLYRGFYLLLEIHPTELDKT